MNQAAAMQPEPFEVPDGGLATFLSANTGDWADDAPEYRIIKPVAAKLAEFGREGDTRIAHVANGETVIPMEVLDADPELKRKLFDSMREQGLEPERYVVGNELNSINPATGQPEFFLKKLFKGVKKLVKGVVKVFKKIAPIVLPIALNFLFPGLGAIASGALGSGIGTLVQGGNLKDAFKSALIGGAIGGLASGVSGAISGEGFVSGLKGALPAGTVEGAGVFGGGAAPTPAPIEQGIPDVIVGGAEGATQAATSLADAAGAAAQPNMLQSLANQTGGQLGGGLAPNIGAVPAPAAAGASVSQPNMLQSLSDQTGGQLGGGIAPTAASPAASQPNMLQSLSDQTGGQLGGGLAPNVAGAGAQAGQRGFFDTMGDYLFRGGSSPSDIIAQQAQAAQEAYASHFKAYLDAGATEAVAKTAAEAAAKTAAASAGPGMLAKYGPMLGLGVLGLAATGGFETPEQDVMLPYDGLTGRKLIDMYPNIYNISAPGSNYVPITARDGGEIQSYPRMNGAIYGPGTETSDDVPAMLSDGEFVMTARAVRGAGNGSRQDGMRRMYEMMRNFEGRAPRGN